MGNRANINVRDNKQDHGVYLYTHWDGSQLPILLQETLNKKERWDDTSYLTRMIFSTMIKYDINGTTGYGISTYLTDNENPLIYVYIDKQTITINDESFTFNEYICLTTDEIYEIYNR